MENQLHENSPTSDHNIAPVKSAREKLIATCVFVQTVVALATLIVVLL